MTRYEPTPDGNRQSAQQRDLSKQTPDRRYSCQSARSAATATAAGVLAVALTTSPAMAAAAAPPAVATPAIMLTSGATSPVQDLLAQIVNAQATVIATNSQYPFVTEFDKTLLPAYAQMSAMNQIILGLSQYNLDHGYSQNSTSVVPYQWNSSAAEPFNFLNSPNPDEQYHLLPVGDKTEVVTVRPGPGTEEVTFTMMTGDGMTKETDWHAVVAHNLDQFTPNADGSYTIYVGPSAPTGANWIDTDGYQTVLVRDTLGDWGLPQTSISVQLENQPAFTMPVLSDADISSLLAQTGDNLVSSNASFTLFGLQYVFNTIPMNTVKDWATTTSAIPGGPLLPGQITSFVHYSIPNNEAMVIKVPNIDATYTGAQISNAWTATSPYATVTGSLNNTQVYQDSDGYTYYVLSNQNPGVANWINTSGLQDGLFALRIQGLNGDMPANAQIVGTVPVGEVGQLLPSDYPTVSAAEYAAEIQQRLLQYDYVMDQTHDPIGWVTTNLEYDQIKAAVGESQFNTIFGSQQDVPSLLNRMTDSALMPSLGSVITAFLENPGRSTAAIIDNLALAAKDIDLPAVLNTLRMEMITGDTFQAIRGDFSSGDFSQAWTDFTGGLRDLGGVVNQMWTDPATSITAGFLNARDDLAVSILNSSSHSQLALSDFTSAWDELSDLHQPVFQMLSAGFGYMLGFDLPS